VESVPDTLTLTVPTGPTLKGDQIADQLRNLILSGELPVGTPLRQTALARRFGASIIPFREAIRCLEQEGLVVAHAFRGAEVAPLVPEEILEFARIRVALETELLALAHPNHTAATLGEARGFLLAGSTVRGPVDYFRVYSLFLRALYAPAGHPRMVEEVLRIFAQSQRYVSLFVSYLSRFPAELPSPMSILQSMEAGDVGQAQERLRVLYLKSAILGAGFLYQRQMEEVPRVKRPRGRPRKNPAP
jgi:DNA-binding GntR family transcriptional regulator